MQGRLAGGCTQLSRSSNVVNSGVCSSFSRTTQPLAALRTTYKGGHHAKPATTAATGSCECQQANLSMGTSASQQGSSHQAALTSAQADDAYSRLPFYSHYPLDRKTEWRRDAQKLAQLYASPQARLLPVLKDKCLIYAPPSQDQSTSTAAHTPGSPVLLQPASDFVAVCSPSTEHVFLGVDNLGAAVFAADITDPAGLIKSLPFPATWKNTRHASIEMGPGDAALVAVANSLMDWHRENMHHGGSGVRTQPRAGGHSRKCSRTGQLLYPRIDPAVIMLATCEDYCLLGRKREWPTGRYSTLAGFLEVGEALEAAVVREVMEEAAVATELHTVRYLGSQPWPFPRSLMAAFFVDAPPGPALPGSAAAAAAGAAPDAALAPALRTDVGGSAASGGGSKAAAAGAAVVPYGYDLLPPAGRAAAMDVGLTPQEALSALWPPLQRPQPDVKELEDARWFHREWLHQALGPRPPPGNKDFIVPGHWAISNRLITTWMGQRAAAACGGSSSSAGGADADWVGGPLPQVRLDVGTFKYMLVRVVDEATARSKLVVWGDAQASYHMDVLEACKAKALELSPSLRLEPLGGGRIEHHPEQGLVSIYGYSSAYGAAPHDVTAALVRKWYPFYEHDAVLVAYEGY